MATDPAAILTTLRQFRDEIPELHPDVPGIRRSIEILIQEHFPWVAQHYDATWGGWRTLQAGDSNDPLVFATKTSALKYIRSFQPTRYHYRIRNQVTQEILPKSER
jgi:hypothetical protein